MKFGARLLDEAPPELGGVMFRYTDMKSWVKEATSVGGERGGPDDAPTTPLVDTTDDFAQLLRDELARTSSVTEGLGLALQSEIAAMQASGDESAAADIFNRIDSLHRYVVLTYIAVFKIVKKWNKHYIGGKELAALPFLANAPIFSSRTVQVLLQRGAKNRQDHLSPRKARRSTFTETGLPPGRATRLSGTTGAMFGLHPAPGAAGTSRDIHPLEDPPAFRLPPRPPHPGTPQQTPSAYPAAGSDPASAAAVSSTAGSYPGSYPAAAPTSIRGAGAVGGVSAAAPAGPSSLGPSSSPPNAHANGSARHLEANGHGGGDASGGHGQSVGSADWIPGGDAVANGSDGHHGGVDAGEPAPGMTPTRRGSVGGLSVAIAAARESTDCDGGDGLVLDDMPAQNVCCNLCVRKQNRFVILGCSHTFCWPCISSTVLRLPATEKDIPLLRSRLRNHSRDSLRGSSPLGSLGHTAMELGTPVGTLGTNRATPPAAGWWPGDNDSDSGLGLEDPKSFVKCAVCDTLEDLSAGHMEVNPLLGDYSYIWIAAPMPKNGRNHGTSQSQLAGFNFGSIGRSYDRTSALTLSAGQPVHMMA